MPEASGHPASSPLEPKSVPPRRQTRWFENLRARRPWLDMVFKIGIATVGVLLTVGGILIAPLPGPGGFIAFFGIALLATEFIWARRAVRRSQAVGHRWHVRLTGKRPRWAYRLKRRMRSPKPTDQQE